MESFPEALRSRFRSHAGLDQPTSSSSIFTDDGRPAAHADLLEAFELLNTHLNGPAPSETTTAGPDTRVIPADVAYAVSEITTMLRKAGDADHASAIEVAWNGVLAGDIDDIHEHVRLEQRAAS
jgi:hypothetical protein